MLLTGLEPVRCIHREILSLLRLPISPQQLICMVLMYQLNLEEQMHRISNAVSRQKDKQISSRDSRNTNIIAQIEKKVKRFRSGVLRCEHSFFRFP